jgi:hypothetical protein
MSEANLPPEAKDPNWRPYCLMCDTMLRMTKESYGYKCQMCRNEINHDLTHHHPEPQRRL